MKCAHCGSNLPERFSFCPQCGVRVRDMSGNPIPSQVTTDAKPDFPKAAPMPKQKKQMNMPNLVLCGILAANLIGGAVIFNGVRQKKAATSQTSVAEESEAETTTTVSEAPAKTTSTETEAVTTEPETTTAPAVTTKAPEVTTAKTTKTTTAQTTKQTTSKITKQTTTQTTAAPTKKTEPRTQPPAVPDNQPDYQEPSGTTANDYYATLGWRPFSVGNGDDPFMLPGLWTRASNNDGNACSEDTAKRAMLDLPINWGDDYDIYCGTKEDNNGTADSTYRYIVDAFPVPGYSDLQMPAAVDLYIHNGTQGNYLRAIDYRYGMHTDYTGPYVWTYDDIANIFYNIANYADSLYGGHESVSDNNFEHYRYNDGALDMGFYEKNGRNVLWISRAND
ncbi:MAG: zinc ribbon domain-containing protein [Oscillospiraceae bacterium]|nr:zinc ribbon domain-containing protein [Oscillospiraceae bacterium]